MSNVVTAISGDISTSVSSGPASLIAPGNFLNNDNVVSSLSSPPYFSTQGMSVQDSTGTRYNIYNDGNMIDNAKGIFSGGFNVQLATDSLTISCLLQGTKIFTENGYIPIENLKEGQFILNDNGKIEIIKIYKSEYKVIDKFLPYKIPRHFFYKNHPFEDLFLTEHHAVKYGNEFVSPSFLNCKRSDNVKSDVLTYYHIELKDMEEKNKNSFKEIKRRKNYLIANGIIVESYSKEET
jgi:hypothetical protein